MLAAALTVTAALKLALKADQKGLKLLRAAHAAEINLVTIQSLFQWVGLGQRKKREVD